MTSKRKIVNIGKNMKGVEPKRLAKVSKVSTRSISKDKRIEIEGVWDTAIENGVDMPTKKEMAEMDELRKNYVYWCRATGTCLYCGTGKDVITLGANICHKCLLTHRWEKPGAMLEPNDNWAMFTVCCEIIKHDAWKKVWSMFKNG